MRLSSAITQIISRLSVEDYGWLYMFGYPYYKEGITLKHWLNDNRMNGRIFNDSLEILTEKELVNSNGIIANITNKGMIELKNFFLRDTIEEVENFLIH